MSVFSIAEVVDLIKEVGQSVTLVAPSATTSQDARLGIPASQTLIRKELQGYLVASQNSDSAIAVKGGNSRTGEYECYISGHNITRAEFAPGVRLEVQGELFEINYKLGHLSRGRTVLHELVITPVR